MLDDLLAEKTDQLLYWKNVTHAKLPLDPPSILDASFARLALGLMSRK